MFELLLIALCCKNMRMRYGRKEGINVLREDDDCQIIYDSRQKIAPANIKTIYPQCRGNQDLQTSSSDQSGKTIQLSDSPAIHEGSKIPPHDVDDDVEIVYVKPPKRSDENKTPRRNELSTVHESNNEHEVKEIKILLCKRKLGQRIVTMDVPYSCKEEDIISVVFPNAVITRNNGGYKIVLDDKTEQRVVMKLINDPIYNCTHMIDIQ